MTSQPSRRVRRRQFTSAIQDQPEKTALSGSPRPAAAPRVPRRPVLSHREHHVTTDYGYIHKDLLTILGVGVVVVAFIVGMSFAV